MWTRYTEIVHRGQLIIELVRFALLDLSDHLDGYMRVLRTVSKNTVHR